MKKFLFCICICTLLFGSVAYAADRGERIRITAEFTASLEADANVEQTLGEAVIFMIENNILGKLNEAGETEFADELKLSADDALDASANSSEDARSLAIEYCTNLEEAMTLLPLIENGSFTFTYALPEDKTFESNAENGIDITLPKGTLLPTDWELTHQSSRLTDSRKTVSLEADDTALETTNSLVFAGAAFVLKQKVTALIPGQSYKLSLLMSAANQFGITVTINYLNYDDSFSGTFTKSVQLCGNAVSKSEDCSVGFTLPPDADTAEIIITINGGTASAVRIDNIELTESDELITNGTFENYRSDKDWFTTWNTTPNIYPKADGKVITGAATDNYAGLDASGEALTQAVLAKPQKLYRLSFDYAQSGFADTSELSPVVTLTYSGNNGEEKSVVSPVFSPVPQTEAGAAEPTWTTYEAYIVTPAVDTDYAFDLVNMTLKMSAGQGENWTDGAMLYYDDISLTEADDTMIGFASGANGSFVTVAPSAKTASCVYVQQTSNTIHKFIVAKYSKETETLAEASVYDVGKDLPAGKAARLDIPLDAYDANCCYKIFLWKDTDSTLVPIVASKEIGR